MISYSFDTKDKRGMGFIGIGLLVLGLAALYFIYQIGLVGDFINFIRG